MRIARLFAAHLSLVFAAALPAAASNLVTGNGFGFAVVAPTTATVTKFYPHPYSFVRPDPKNPLGEGIETPNFIKRLRWISPSAMVTLADYLDDSHVIHAGNDAGENWIFMPFGLQRPVLILASESTRADAPPGGFAVEWNRPVKSEKKIKLAGDEATLLQFDGIDESLLLIALGPAIANIVADQPLASHAAWALVSLESPDEVEQAVGDIDRWRAGLSPRALVKREIDQFEQWRVKPAANFTSDQEKHLWRQSETMLRIAQSREPNRADRHGNGLIVAALPDGVYFTPWVRDMAWATVAFARMGHRDEARAALLAYFNAQPTGKMRTETAGADYQVSVVRYFGDGSEEPFFTMEGAANIEFDDWGEVLWALGEYLRTYDDPALLTTPTYRGRLYESARDFIARPLIANTEKHGDGLIVAADTSIWEEHQKDKKHFAFSTAAAILGLHSFSAVAERAGDKPTHDEMMKDVGLLQKGFNTAFLRNGRLHGTLEEGEKNDVDGALLPIVNFGIVRDPAVVRDVVDRMELLKVASGGYRRVRSNYTDPAIFEYWYERQEFVFVDFSLAELWRKLGRTSDASAMLNRIVDKAAADHYILPEMYVALPCKLFPGEIGDPTGAIPMVGYGAGAYILHLLDRTKPGP